MPPIDRGQGTGSGAPRISVVIPTYNRGSLIRRTVDSALHQTVPADEILVIDDGSTDDTRTQMAPYASRVTYIYQNNVGASLSRNHGVLAARNEWIAFLDSDDVWVETHLERMGRTIGGTGGCVPFYFSDMELPAAEGGGSLWKSLGFSIEGDYAVIPDGTGLVMMDRQPTMLQCSVFRRSDYLAYGGLQERYRLTHDTHIFMKLGIGSPVCAVAGLGTIQTADDVQDNRLTFVLGGRTAGYWHEAIDLWQDIERSFPHLAPEYRRILQQRLAHAHWRLSRFAWNGKKFGAALSEAYVAGTHSPLTLLSILSHPFLSGRRRAKSRDEGREQR